MPDKDIVYEQEFQIGEHTLRLVVKKSKIQKYMSDYHAALRKVRGIPFNLDTVSPNWPAYRAAYDGLRYMLASNPQSPTLQEKHAQAAAVEAIEYYKKLSDEAYTEAGILALTKETVLDGFEAKPYDNDDDDDEVLPGLEQAIKFPRIERDISNPLEYRLKQIYDLFIKSGRENEILTSMNSGMLRAAVMLEETNEDGFQPKRTRRNQSTKNAGNG